jgi:hypothetical protein
LFVIIISAKPIRLYITSPTSKKNKHFISQNIKSKSLAHAKYIGMCVHIKFDVFECKNRAAAVTHHAVGSRLGVAMAMWGVGGPGSIPSHIK